MKKLVEVSGEGLESLLGEKIQVWCNRYIYAGVLAGVNAQDILLHDAVVVYQTGAFDADEWEDAQEVGVPLYVRISFIESYSTVTK